MDAPSFLEEYTDFIYNVGSMAGEFGARADALRALSTDFVEMCSPKDWPALADAEKSAWLAELRRRLVLIFGKQLADLATFDKKSNAWLLMNAFLKAFKTEAERLAAVNSPLQSVQSIVFSQFSINFHFQGNYEGQPQWLANQEIVTCAKLLRANPELSLTMRIKLYLHGGQWLCMNNRGFALHSLAAVVPQRLVFVTKLNSEETKRLGDKIQNYLFEFGQSIPESRANVKCLSATIPSPVVAVSPSKPSDDKIVKLPVWFTIKAHFSDGSDNNRDPGNEIVFNNFKG